MSSLPQALQRAYGAYDNGELLEAERFCTTILTIDGKFLDALDLLALTQSKLGKNNAALDNYDRLLAIRPDYPEALSNRGNALQALGRFDEALDSYDRALALRPEFADALNNRGNALQALGRFDEALRSYEQAIQIRPDDAVTLNNHGNALQALGRLDEALKSYKQALEIRPDYAEAFNNRGIALRELKRFDEALKNYERALEIRPDYPEAFNNRGVTLHELARFDEALESYERAIAIRPEFIEALNNQGITLQKLARFERALERYERVLAISPDHAEALNNRGIALFYLARFAEALVCCERALAIRSNYAEALNTRGMILRELNRIDEALESYQRALEIRPDFAEALNNRAMALHGLRRFEEELEYSERALAVWPDFAEALDNRGVALHALGRFDEALESFQQALTVWPDFAACHVNRAFLLLLTGHFAEGWREAEWRRKKDTWTARSLPGSEWTWGDAAARRVLFYSEQGLGDTIQFSRFACAVAASGKEAFLEVQPSLVGLLGGLKGVRVIGRGVTPPEHDAELPLMSLPHVLGTTPETIPRDVPYLFAEPARAAAWAKRLPAGQFRVGIVWQGNSTADIDIGRSMPLSSFAPLCHIPRVTLISLQKYDGVEQLAQLPPGMSVETLGEELDAGPDAFVDTAAVMMNLDLVITSDTAAAHLAGALGRPVWIVLKHVPDWRWLMDRGDTPWYPTARLFRQARRDDWEEVFERIAGELARAAAAKTTPVNPLTQESADSLDATHAVPPGTALVPVSFGELVDKITILEIKSERISDTGKLANVHLELDLLSTAAARFSVLPPRAGELKAELRQINEALWEIEDQIRDCERNNDFGVRFVGLARGVYLTNDRRSVVKRQLNQLAGSVIVEEKSYVGYI
jgi:tetratricopeptide (TPR) repeat protein